MKRLNPLTAALLGLSLFLAACGSTDDAVKKQKPAAEPASVLFAKVAPAPEFVGIARVRELAKTSNIFTEPRPLSRTEGMAVMTGVAAKFGGADIKWRTEDGTLPEADILLTPNAPLLPGGSLDAYCSEWVTGDTGTGWITLFYTQTIDKACGHVEKAMGLMMGDVSLDEVWPPPGVAIEFTGLEPGAVYVLDIGMFEGSTINLAGLKNIAPKLKIPEGGHLVLSFIAEAETAPLFISIDYGEYDAVAIFYYAGLTKVSE